MPDKKTYTAFIIIAIVLLILLWLLLESRQRTRQIGKTIQETTFKQ